MKNKRTIIAMSGGSWGEHRDTYFNSDLPTGVQNYPCETLPIDELIIKASNKQKPKVCCIMTAGDDLLHNFQRLAEGLKRRFGDLGAEVEILRLTYYSPNDAEIKTSLEVADIIYVTGGNSYTLDQTLKRRRVDQLLISVVERGTVLSGLSAGLCCWFSHIMAAVNSGAGTDESTTAFKINSLGWFKALVTPHWDIESFRHKPFHKALLDDPGLVGLAFEEYTAIEICNDSYRLHQFASGGKVYRGHYDKNTGIYSFKPLQIDAELRPLSDLGITVSS